MALKTSKPVERCRFLWCCWNVNAKKIIAIKKLTTVFSFAKRRTLNLNSWCVCLDVSEMSLCGEKRGTSLIFIPLTNLHKTLSMFANVVLENRKLISNKKLLKQPSYFALMHPIIWKLIVGNLLFSSVSEDIKVSSVHNHVLLLFPNAWNVWKNVFVHLLNKGKKSVGAEEGGKECLMMGLRQEQC